MRTTILIAIMFFWAGRCDAQGIHNCFSRVKQNHSTSIPATLKNIQKKLAAIDFYLEDHQKVIKKVEGVPKFDEDDRNVKLNGGECDMMDNYNVFRMYVRKRKQHKGQYYPKFTITAYEFQDSAAATVFYEKVLRPLASVLSDRKEAYSCLLSGKYCYYIQTPAYMYHYDFMGKVIRAIDGKGEWFNHL